MDKERAGAAALRVTGWSIRLAILILTLVVVASIPSDCLAAQSRSYSGDSFGPDGVGGTESFGFISSIAVDQSSGDVYVLEAFSSRIYKFGPAGEPIAFSSTGTNSFPVSLKNIEGVQIAIAPTGSPGGTAGNIYVVDKRNESPRLPTVGVYAASGAPLGRFGPIATSVARECGVATDDAGHIFVSLEGAILEYTPTTNPPTEADLTGSSRSIGDICNLAVDRAGNIYASQQTNQKNALLRLQGIGAAPTEIGPGAPTLAVSSESGTVFADETDQITEYGAGGSPTLGIFGLGLINGSKGIGVDSTGEKVYVSDGEGKVKIFGAPALVPTVTAGDTAFSLPTAATLHGTVDPEGVPVTECFFEYGNARNNYNHITPCLSLPPTNSEPNAVSAEIGNLEPDGVTYHFRLVAENADGRQLTPDQTFVTPPTVVTEAAGPVGEETATLNGKVFPNSTPYSECKFEYGLVSDPTLSEEAPCVPSAAAIPADDTFHQVSADLTGLKRNDAKYRFRLVATNARGTVRGNTVFFTTSGEPGLEEVRATGADQNSATLEGAVDPHGFETHYSIEWGTTTAYGRVATSGAIEPNQGATSVRSRIEGLSPGIIYHFRVTASNVKGTVTSLDHEVEALNGCGLPQGRCFELVSPKDAGPVASPGHGISLLNFELTFQAADQPGALAYVSESGYPGATRGAEVLYKATRSSEGWSNSQLAPPITTRDETSGEHSNSSRTVGLSSDLACGVVETNQVLPGTTSAMNQVLEAGGENLYRENPDGSYTPITTSPPDNLSEGSTLGGGVYFGLAGISSDCTTIYFSSTYHYPKTGALGHLPLYEWRNGKIRSVGLVPGPSAEVAVSAALGSNGPELQNGRADRGAVSADGSRIFFSAERQTGNNPAEVGRVGLFVREGGSVTRDVSLSETTVPDREVRYQYATPDGSRVFFTAPAGLTNGASTEGTDLYEYDLEEAPSEHPLRDLSSGGAEPAEVAGMLGASDDGSRVYFAARGRLVPAEGLSAAENRAENAYSLYLNEAGHLRFIATVSEQPERLTLSESARTTSQVSPEGRYLLFESALPATDYDSQGAPEAYLFDAGAPSEAISCVSCRSDGQPSAVEPFYSLLTNANQAGPLEPRSAPRALTVSHGRPSVVFSSLDPLAPGARENDSNLYEWSHGQVFLISVEPPDLQSAEIPGGGAPQPPGTERFILSLGSDTDGSDFYFSTPESLVRWEDGDERFSVYDARVGGGFSQPAAPPPQCDPAAEGACQNAAAPPPASPSPESPKFVGPGNPKPKTCKKGQVKKHGKCVKAKNHKNKKAKKKHQHKKHANGKRRAGK